MKAHINLYKQLERSDEGRFQELVADTPIEVVKEVAEDGLVWHLVHYRERMDELLQDPKALTPYGKGRLWVARGTMATPQGPVYDGRDLLVADQCFAEAVQRGVKVGPSLHNRANLQVMMRNVLGAEPLLKAAVRAGHTDANLLLGNIQAALGRGKDEEERLYRLAFPTEDPQVAMHFGSWLKGRGRLEEARPHLDEAVRLGMPAAYYLAGETKGKMGDREGAVEDMLGAAAYRVPQAVPALQSWGLNAGQIRERVRARWQTEEATL